jgi:hypothetical protein
MTTHCTNNGSTSKELTTWGYAPSFTKVILELSLHRSVRCLSRIETSGMNESAGKNHSVSMQTMAIDVNEEKQQT